MSTKILVIEDDERIRSGFELAIRACSDFDLIGIAGDLPDGRRLLAEGKPDVMIVDIGLPSGSGIDLIDYARRHLPNCESLVVTVFADEQEILRSIEAGATGYLLKDATPVDIVEQVKLLCAGGSPISPSVARRLMQCIGGQSTEANLTRASSTISDQECAVLSLSAKGYSYEEVARMLNLSRHTVGTYVKRIYRKLQVHSKTEAVYEARKMGIVRD